MTANQPGVWTRRRFLKTLGATSGGAAVMNAMSAWGMLPAAALAQTEPPQLEGRAEGTSVIVIGTGPGGSAAAYELIKLGYDVTILEANDRVGGHAFTVRGGSKTTEYGKGEQVCDWDEGVWYDAGPSRIPFYHRAFFHYSKELGIPLIDYNNINLNAWTYAEGIAGSLDGQRIRLNALQADMAGYTSELLAKAADAGTLDDQLTRDDMEQLVDYLVTWGLLSADDLTYVASDHRGYAVPPDTQGAGEVDEPFPLSDLLPFANAVVGANAGYLAATPVADWQRTLVSPAEGVGQLFDAEEGFRGFFGDRLKLRCEVTGIENTENGVAVTYTNLETGEEDQQLTADYCVCNIPLSVLIKLNTNFSQPFTDAMRSVPYAMALRMGAQFNQRFWETEDWIYGGQSFSNIRELGIVGYPNADYLADKGAMLIMYNFGTNAARISSLPYEERAEVALKHVSKIHPQAREHFHSAFSVAWHLEPHALGAWPSYTELTRARYMPILQEPEGNVYLVGEHLSYVNAWMEGAFQSAWLQVPKLHERVLQPS
jgi:monoamine oxidase